MQSCAVLLVLSCCMILACMGILNSLHAEPCLAKPIIFVELKHETLHIAWFDRPTI